MSQPNVYSLMEEKAKLFKKKQEASSFSVLPDTPEDVEKELLQLRQILKTLSEELEVVREAVRKKEKQFTLLANYKHLLQRSQITPKLITQRVKKRDRVSELLDRLEALTPAQLKKLETIEL